MRMSASALAAVLLVFAALLAGSSALVAVDDPPSAKDKEAKDAPAIEKKVPANAPQSVAAQPIAPILRALASGGAVPADLRDPAFDYYVDLRLLGKAWADLDCGLLTDLALQFMEGERVLLRPHRAIRSSELMKIALRLAAVRCDTATLARLEKAIRRSGNKDLIAELTKAKKCAEEAGTKDSAWTVSVAEMSPQAFARYKGTLQDIEAALVVRDRTTLENLQKEVKSAVGLSKTDRAKLVEKIERALASLSAADHRISRAAKVLDKLAHASRRIPSPEIFTFPGPPPDTIPPQPPTPPSTPPCSPPPGTQPPAVPPSTPPGSPPPGTQPPAVPPSNPPTVTMSPTEPSYCPVIPTQCPPETTECPQTATQCYQAPTECQTGPTQCPRAPTVCQQLRTVCPTRQSWCPLQQCQRVTQYPSYGSTDCVPGKGDRPTLYPSVPTRCPAVYTQCPQAFTYCPGSCQQQQQKQKWTPPPGKYGPPPGYQQPYPYRQPYGRPAAPTYPYRRRAYGY